MPGHWTALEGGNVYNENGYKTYSGVNNSDQYMRTSQIYTLHKGDSITIQVTQTDPITHNRLLTQITIIDNDNNIIYGNAFLANKISQTYIVEEESVRMMVCLLFGDHYRPMTVEECKSSVNEFICYIALDNRFKDNLTNFVDEKINYAISSNMPNLTEYAKLTTIKDNGNIIIPISDFVNGGYESTNEQDENGNHKLNKITTSAIYAHSSVLDLYKGDYIYITAGAGRTNSSHGIYIKIVVINDDGYIIHGYLTSAAIAYDEYLVTEDHVRAFAQILGYDRSVDTTLTTLQTYFTDGENFECYYKPWNVESELNKINTKISNNNNGNLLSKVLSGNNFISFEDRVHGFFTYENNTVKAFGSTDRVRYCDPFTFTCELSGNYELSGCPETNQNTLCYIQGTTVYNKNGVPRTYYLEAGQTYTYRIIAYAGCDFGEGGITYTPSLVFKDIYKGTDKSVSIEGQPADAYSVRTLINNLKTQQAAGGADTNSLEVAFLGNVSLGDCTLLQFNNGTNFLIDCMVEAQWSKLHNDLLTRDCQHLDYFMISHYHSDHTGCFFSLCDAGYIDSNTTVILPPKMDNSYDQSPYPDGNRDTWLTLLDIETNIIAKVQELNCTLLAPNELDEIDISGCRVIFWNCDHSWFYGNSANYNDWSICCYIINNNVSLCFTGDLGPIGQRHVMSLHNMLKANIYKTCHHGWSNGINTIHPPYINSVDPDVCISLNSNIHISAGYIDSANSPIQSWCEMNGRSHYMTIMNNNAIDIHVDKFGWHFKGMYIRYIRGENHKNWKYIDNDTEYAET